MRDPTGQVRDESVRRHGDLEIEENMEAQRRLWRFQRWARSVVVLLLLSAILGAFGGGPFSKTTMVRGASSVEYDRAGYADTPQRYQFRLGHQFAKSGTLTIWFANEALSELQIEKIVPEPSRAVLGPKKTFFDFETRLIADGADMQVSYFVQHRKAGWRNIRAGIEDGPDFELHQLIHP